MRYEIVAETYRDLEQATGRLALIDRLAGLFRQTPNDLLPTVALLCQGQIAPDFAGVELGVAERMAARAVAQAAGTTPEQVLAGARELGDLGLTAEQLLGELEPDRPATLEVADGVRGPAPDRRGPGHRLAGPQAGRAGRPARPGDAAGGPLPGAHLYRQPAPGDRHRHHPGRPGRGACRRPQAAIDPGAGLQHLLRPVAGRRHPGRRRPGRGRGDGGAGRQPGAADAGPASQRAGRDPRQAGRELRGRVQVRRHPGAGPPHIGWPPGAVHPPPRPCLDPVPRGGEAARREPGAARGDPGGRGRGLRPGLGGAAAVPGRDVPPPQVRHHRGGPGLPRQHVLLRAAVRRRHRPHPAPVPGTAGAAGRGDHAVAAAAAGHRRAGARRPRPWSWCSRPPWPRAARG